MECLKKKLLNWNYKQKRMLLNLIEVKYNWRKNKSDRIKFRIKWDASSSYE